MDKHVDDLGEPDFELGGLSFWVFSYAFPDSHDYWSVNWLNFRARVVAPGACVEIGGPMVLRTDDLAHFLDQLAALYRDLNRTAKLECIEHDLVATVTCGLRGEIKVIVEITPDQLTQSHRFIFETDQSYLAATLAGLERLLERFPVKGTPEG